MYHSFQLANHLEFKQACTVRFRVHPHVPCSPSARHPTNERRSGTLTPPGNKVCQFFVEQIKGGVGDGDSDGGVGGGDSGIGGGDEAIGGGEEAVGRRGNSFF